MKNRLSFRKLLACLLTVGMLTAMTACGEEETSQPDSVDVSGIAGTWTEVNVFPNTLTVNEDGSFAVKDHSGEPVAEGTVKVEEEEHPDGSKSLWYDFYRSSGEFWAGFSKDGGSDRQDHLYSGHDGEMHFMRDGIDEKLTPESYLHTWICDRCSIEIKKSKKAYVATITWGSSAFETSFWTYPCTFDKKTTSLVCKGGAVHKDVTYSDDGKEKTKIIYKDGSGSFKIVSGTLRWTDDKENSGEGMCFVESQMD